MATQLLLSFPPSAEVSDAEYDKTIRSFCVSVKKLSLSALVGSNTSGQGNHLEVSIIPRFQVTLCIYIYNYYHCHSYISIGA